MEKVDSYRCELCGSLYDTEAGAVACNMTHATPIAARSMVVRIRYGEITHDHGEKYPKAVMIEMSDGSTVRYSRA